MLPTTAKPSTQSPSGFPTYNPSLSPVSTTSTPSTATPTRVPTTATPTRAPTRVPTTAQPTKVPTIQPSSVVPTTAQSPSEAPTHYPSLSPHSISIITSIAGTGTASFSGDGGQATSATINEPSGIAIDSYGNVFFSDKLNNRVRKISGSTGIITTYTGTGTASFSGNGGVASSATLNGPFGLCVDSAGTHTYISSSMLTAHSYSCLYR